MAGPIHKTPPLILEQLHRILGLLVQSKDRYEHLAGRLRNRELQQSLIGLAQETKQYAGELSSQIHSLGGHCGPVPENERLAPLGNPDKNQWEIMDNERSTLQHCAKSGEPVIRAYRELLNEPCLYEGIRRMVRYQLNGLLYAFSRLKLLNATLAGG
jgi:hypothetical protein